MSYNKFLLVGIVGIFFLGTLVCSKNSSGTGPDKNADAQSVAADKSTLTITCAAGDSAGSVTQKVGLPANGASGSSINWITSNASLITTNGNVTRPPFDSADASVTLTATITKGTASDEKVFVLVVKKTIGQPGTVTDIDGNVYHTIQINNQVWTVENLKTTKLSDGSPIPKVTESAGWSTLSSPGYCYYQNTSNADSIIKFGALYNAYAVETMKLAPAGWHIPDTAEWDALIRYVIKTYTVAAYAKSLAGTTDWTVSATPGTIGNDIVSNNASGFSGLPGGCRRSSGPFIYSGNGGYWWSSMSRVVDTYMYYLYYSTNFTSKSNQLKNEGYSVRLIKD